MEHFSFNFLKQLLQREKRKAPSAMHPVREWFVGLLIALTIFAAGAAYAGQFLLRNLGHEGYADGAAADVTTYKQELVRDVLETYEARAASFELLRNAPAAGPIITPSTSGAGSKGEPVGAE